MEEVGVTSRIHRNLITSPWLEFPTIGLCSQQTSGKRRGGDDRNQLCSPQGMDSSGIVMSFHSLSPFQTCKAPEMNQGGLDIPTGGDF